MTGVDAVIFDWGGTLAVHVEVELIDMWRTAAHTLIPEDTDDRSARVSDLIGRLIEVEKRAWASTTSSMRSSRLMDLLRDASDDVQLDVAEAVLQTAQQAHLDAWTPSISHHPEAGALLSAVKAENLATGLLSNTHWPRSFHEQFLQRDGLDQLIDERLYTSEIDWIKPHAEPFERMCERLGVLPSACIFVGDRPIDDITGAMEVGMRTIWIANSHAPGDGSIADRTVDDLGQVWTALGDLAATV